MIAPAATTPAAVLTSNTSFTNDGAIHLSSTGTAYSWLNASTSTVTNSPTGLLHFQSGGTGARYFTADLVNNGIVTVDQQTFFDESTGAHTNNGRINIAIGATLHITLGGTLTNLSSNTLSGGTYDVAGVFEIPGADIHTLGAEVILHGTSGIVDETQADALNDLSVIGPQGALRLLDGANRNRLGSLTIHGELEMGGGLYFLSSGGVDTSATGTVSGVGEIRANFFNNEGTVAPGSGAGILHVTFGYTQASTGLLSIEIFGNDNSDPMNPEYDVLLAGSASLDGILDVSLSNFLPAASDVFTILDANSLSGEFFNVADGERLDTADGEGSFIVDYDNGTGNVTLSSFALVADYNGDGSVNAADYTVWRNSLNQSGDDLPADGDRSGTVNRLDYDFWKARYGQAVGGGASLASAIVPEPAAYSLFATGLAFIAANRRRR
jgi:hypothetical protein